MASRRQLRRADRQAAAAARQHFTGTQGSYLPMILVTILVLALVTATLVTVLLVPQPPVPCVNPPAGFGHGRQLPGALAKQVVC
jgi:hypothetical protein